MARPKNPKGPPPEFRFKPGQSGNPGGRARLPEELRNVRELTTEELKRTIAKHFRMTKDQIAAVMKDINSTALELIICSTIAKAISQGDIAKAEYLFSRTLGKVTEKIDIQHPEPVIIRRTSGETVALDVKREEPELISNAD